MTRFKGARPPAPCNHSSAAGSVTASRQSRHSNVRNSGWLAKRGSTRLSTMGKPQLGHEGGTSEFAIFMQI